MTGYPKNAYPKQPTEASATELHPSVPRNGTHAIERTDYISVSKYLKINDVTKREMNMFCSMIFL
jgi:hypothetical protein